ncbi:hypothetical protein [Pseudomonas sp. ANT_J28]|uniref:hypothetical protein n=1 Tax=Pseudomonas sp. ANT_J28 TaxID=2597352 RepID=UPI0011F1A308|nr:hypothetical protein [Pseudomonas sp. ANT_J28]KAA0977241.1 hypothetical protein FQ187_26845 [Pseudomonas sp. ANT_J28]
MKRTFLLPLLIALALGGAVIAGQNGAGVKVIYDVMPNPIADNNNPEPLFLRGRNEWRHDCDPCDQGDAFLDGKANTDNPRVFETFNSEFINLHEH